MKVKDCMTKDVVTVKKNTSLRALISIFKKHNFRMLPVIDDDQNIIGVITFEDILKAFQPYGANLARILRTMPHLFLDDDVEEDLVLSELSPDMGMLLLVDDLMNPDFATLEEDDDIARARSLMKVHGKDSMPVAKDGKLVGVLSLFDIIISVFKDKGLI